MTEPHPDAECFACHRPFSDHGKMTSRCLPGFGASRNSRFTPSGRRFVPRKDSEMKTPVFEAAQ